MLKAYEIYTKCPDTGTLGWDIARVWSTPDRIEQYPDFDCIITINDCNPTETFMPSNQEQRDFLTVLSIFRRDHQKKMKINE